MDCPGNGDAEFEFSTGIPLMNPVLRGMCACGSVGVTLGWTTSSVAYPTPPETIGMAQVFSDVPYMVMLTLLGAGTGLVLLTRPRREAIVANIALAVFLMVATVHFAIDHGVLFGLETLVVAGVIALASQRIFAWAFSFLRSRPSTRRGPPA